MFTFKLELETGEAVEPAKFVTAVPGWKPGDRVLIRPGAPAPGSQPATTAGRSVRPCHCDNGAGLRIEE
jgi:hypothetical protein